MTTATKNNELKVLVCSGNLGNAEPTQASMEAWIPALGSTRGVVLSTRSTSTGTDADEEEDGFFDLIAIGMQESTWKKNKDGSNNNNASAAPEGWWWTKTTWKKTT